MSRQAQCPWRFSGRKHWGREMRGEMTRLAVSDEPTGCGRHVWLVSDGFGPEQSTDPHEWICFLNAGRDNAAALVTFHFDSTELVGDVEIKVQVERAIYMRTDQLLSGAAEFPRRIPYAGMVRSLAHCRPVLKAGHIPSGSGSHDRCGSCPATTMRCSPPRFQAASTRVPE